MSDVNIQEHMGAAINARVKEVLEFYLNGTPEEFESASRAVMNELSSMGDALHGIVQVDNIDLNDAGDRESLAKQLTCALRESKGWD